MKLLSFIMAFFIVVLTISCTQTPAVHFEEKTEEISNYSKQQIWTFETDQVGVTADSFIPYVGKWQILIDEKISNGNHVFAQLMKNSGLTYNIVFIKGSNFKNVNLSVKMKSVAGRIDQGGGLVWRAKDKNNYYIARYNPLEENFRVYKVVEGRRSQLQSAYIKRILGWHDIHVIMEGARIMCYYDGNLYLDVQDFTFERPGQIGLWTKADAQTYFDDLTASVRKNKE